MINERVQGCIADTLTIIDEFCKHFDAENAGNLLEDNSGVKRRRRQASLSDSEIMTILLHFPYCIRHSVIPNWGIYIYKSLGNMKFLKLSLCAYPALHYLCIR